MCLLVWIVDSAVVESEQRGLRWCGLITVGLLSIVHDDEGCCGVSVCIPHHISRLRATCYVSADFAFFASLYTHSSSARLLAIGVDKPCDCAIYYSLPMVRVERDCATAAAAPDAVVAKKQDRNTIPRAVRPAANYCAVYGGRLMEAVNATSRCRGCG